MKKLILASLLIFSKLVLNAQWIHTSDVNVPNNYISSMAKVGNTVFVGTAELYKTTDNGATWVHVTGIADDYAPIVFANGNNVYVATNDVGDYFSTDGGISWGFIVGANSPIFPTCIAVGSGKIFVGQQFLGGGVYISLNNGTDWTFATALLQKNIMDIALSGNNLFAASSDNGVYYSPNLGSTWTAVNNGISSTQKVYAVKFKGTSILAGTDAGIFISNNLGTNWTLINSGLPVGVKVLSIEVSGNIIFIGTQTNGVYYSVNNGATWTAMNPGLNTSVPINKLLANGNRLFAGTSGDGVYVTTDVIGINEQNSSYEAISVYPNPAAAAFTIISSDFALRKLEVLNLEGEIVYNNTLMEIGSKQETINCELFSKGVYFIHITTEKNSSVQKLVISE